MKRQEIVEAFIEIDINNLNISERDKKIAQLYLNEVSIKEIAEEFNLSKSRIGHIMAKAARFANIYRKNPVLYKDQSGRVRE